VPNVPYNEILFPNKNNECLGVNILPQITGSRIVSFPISKIFWGACPQIPLEDKGPSAPFDNSGKCQRYAATCFKSYWKHCVKPILRQLNNHVYSVLLLLSSRPHCIEGSLHVLSYDHTGEHIHVTILKICQIWVLPSAVTSNTPTHVMSCNDE